MSKHNEWMRRGTVIYIEGGGFDVRYCPEPEALAEKIVTAVNYHERLVEALRSALDWIDSVPADTQLPAMPGFDRDEVDAMLAEILDTKKD